MKSKTKSKSKKRVTKSKKKVTKSKKKVTKSKKKGGGGGGGGDGLVDNSIKKVSPILDYIVYNKISLAILNNTLLKDTPVDPKHFLKDKKIVYDMVNTPNEHDVIIRASHDINRFLNEFITQIYSNLFYFIEININKCNDRIDIYPKELISKIASSIITDKIINASCTISLLQNNTNIKYKYTNLIEFKYSSDQIWIFQLLRQPYREFSHAQQTLSKIGLFISGNSIILKLNDNVLKNIFSIINNDVLLQQFKQTIPDTKINIDNQKIYLKKNEICDMLVFILKNSVFFKNIHINPIINPKTNLIHFERYMKSHCNDLYNDIVCDIFIYFDTNIMLINIIQNNEYPNKYNIKICNPNKNNLFDNIFFCIDTKTNKNKIIFKLNKLYKYTYYKYIYNISPIIDCFNYESYQYDHPSFLNKKGLYYDVKENNLSFDIEYNCLDLIKIILHEDIKKYTKSISNMVHEIKLINTSSGIDNNILKIKTDIINTIFDIFLKSNYIEKYSTITPDKE